MFALAVGGTASLAYSADILSSFYADDYASEAAPSPEKTQGAYRQIAYQEVEYTPGATSVATADPLEAQFDAEAKFKELQLEVAKMQEDLAKKQDKSAPSKKFSNKLGGMLIMDALSVDQSGGNQELYGDQDNMYTIREARLSLKGSGYDVVSYEMTFGFNSSNSQRLNGSLFKNIMVSVKDVPYLQTVKVGHFKVETCMSELDALVNSPGISFFSSNSQAFSPHRRIGFGSAQLYADKRLRVWLGLFSGRGFSDAAYVLDDAPGIFLNTRVTGTPVKINDANGDLYEVVHLGGSGTWYIPGEDGNTLRMRARPTSWTGGMSYLLNSSIALEDGYGLFEGEAAWQRGQLGLVSETFAATIDNYGTSWGTNVSARYFLRPGNYRTYDDANGRFGSAHLVNTFGKSSEDSKLIDSYGELELIAMYSYTDMNNLEKVASSSTIYGEMHEVIGGVNWWWNPSMRWSLAYTQAFANSAKVGSEKNSTSNSTVDMQVNMTF